MAQRRSSALLPSNSMLVPYAHRHFSVAQPINTASQLGIPRGWGIEEVPRHDGSHIDRYYYEPGTGRKFRSIREVHRYLSGEGYPCRSRRTRNYNREYRSMILYSQKSSKHRRMIVSGGKLLRLDNQLSKRRLDHQTAPAILPDGWIVEEVPRRYYSNWTDKYYYEPGTGQKFRSLVAVEKYLAEMDENTPLSKALEEIKENKPLSKVFKLENHTKNSTTRKENMCEENNKETSSFISPPMKVKWVLGSSQGDSWNPFIAEELVPDSVRQQWTNRFMLLMIDESS